MKDRISIIGAGSWGTTLAVIIAGKGIDVELHSVFGEHNLKMQKEHQNKLFLKGIVFPPKLKINSSLKEVLRNEIIIIAVPVKFLRSIIRRVKRTKKSLKGKIFLSAAKGIEANSFKRPSEIIKEELRNVKTAVLSGPTIAREVASGVPTACVIASENKHTAKKLQKVVSTPRFRVYYHHDVIGVELGGALKNIIAIACGISDGLGFGTNTKAAILSRGLVEIARLGKKLGAKEVTFNGISGLGDLATTCFSPYSRNRFVGEKIGKGGKLRNVLARMNMVAEGINTVKSVYFLSKKKKIDMPITKEVYLVLYKNKSPRRAVRDLMSRPLKPEILG
ncbi:MAG: hypothetical protein B1H08_05770 [Candidatus Omnitrophica bacterium 4484_171]|nr:MAG: hypothetical protein B1H08_05770 [Candidatus Omnitrophica bacterium 4484_171]